MTIKGELIGCNTFVSKKGCDCFFGSLAVNYDNKREPNGIGYKIQPIGAFGVECNNVYKQVMTSALVGTIVKCTGLFANDMFQVISIEPDCE